MGNKPTGSSTGAREPIVTERGYNPPPVAKVERPIPSPPAPRLSSPDPAPANSRVRVRTGSGSLLAEDLFGESTRSPGVEDLFGLVEAMSGSGMLTQKADLAKKVKAMSGSGSTHVVGGKTVEVILGK